MSLCDNKSASTVVDFSYPTRTDRPMDIVSEQKDALVALGLTALGFVILVVTTASHEYGLILMRDDRLMWSLTRIVPALAWISLAGVLVLFRNDISWKSAAAAFMVTLVIASTVAVAGAPLGVNAVSVMSTVSYYALTSALLVRHDPQCRPGILRGTGVPGAAGHYRYPGTPGHRRRATGPVARKCPDVR